MAIKNPPLFPHETRQPSVLAAACTTYALAVVFVTLRFVSRRLKKFPIWWDDGLAVLALILATGFFVDAFNWVRMGLGLHYTEIDSSIPDLLRNARLNLFIEEMFYASASAVVKLSILAFYWRIFNITSIRLPIILVTVAVICWLVARTLATILHCIPVQAFWNRTPNAVCDVSDKDFLMGTMTVNFVLDLVILVIPVPYINGLKMKRPQKLVVLGIFACGGFVCIASIILLVECFAFDRNSVDVGWTMCPIIQWAGVEINLAIVSACLPSIRPIVKLVNDTFTDPLNAFSSKYKFSSYGRTSNVMETIGSKKSTAAERLSRVYVGPHSESMETVTIAVPQEVLRLNSTEPWRNPFPGSPDTRKKSRVSRHSRSTGDDAIEPASLWQAEDDVESSGITISRDFRLGSVHVPVDDAI